MIREINIIKSRLLLTILLCSSVLFGNELELAYQKEYAFLKAQKQELKSRLVKEKSQQTKTLQKTKISLERLKNRLVKLSSSVKSSEDRLFKANQNLENIKENKELISNVLFQARELLKQYNIEVSQDKNSKIKEKLKKAFLDANSLYKKLSSKSVQKGSFYLSDGSKVDGEIVKVGNIAAYGLSKSISGALAPAGLGEYKIYNSNKASKTAIALKENKPVSSLDIFIYENINKEADIPKEKKLSDTIKAGGIIGYIILALGVFGALLLILRVVFLFKSSSNVKEITDIVVNKFELRRADEALEAIKNFKGSTARVIKATLRNINQEREHLEDIVMENILNESSSLDRFGNFVLVIAAVSPLLGLLGTVSGMISTFDVITQHGTGDPKLLSSGISEALVTTMLGLIVAIPLLLLGNLLSGWAGSIKDSMEQNALYIVNLYEKTKRL
jgi:biopolymer transport protein ExbB